MSWLRKLAGRSGGERTSHSRPDYVGQRSVYHDVPSRLRTSPASRGHLSDADSILSYATLKTGSGYGRHDIPSNLLANQVSRDDWNETNSTFSSETRGVGLYPEKHPQPKIYAPQTPHRALHANAPRQVFTSQGLVKFLTSMHKSQSSDAILRPIWEYRRGADGLRDRRWVPDPCFVNTSSRALGRHAYFETETGPLSATIYLDLATCSIRRTTTGHGIPKELWPSHIRLYATSSGPSVLLKVLDRGTRTKSSCNGTIPMRMPISIEVKARNPGHNCARVTVLLPASFNGKIEFRKPRTWHGKVGSWHGAVRVSATLNRRLAYPRGVMGPGGSTVWQCTHDEDSGPRSQVGSDQLVIHSSSSSIITIVSSADLGNEVKSTVILGDTQRHISSRNVPPISIHEILRPIVLSEPEAPHLFSN